MCKDKLMIDKISLLNRWHLKCRRNRFANYSAANHFSKKHNQLGVLSVSISAIVGTSVFASLGKMVEPSVQISVGFISLVAAILTALQTFLKYGERSAKHRLIGARYGALVRQIEILSSNGQQDIDIREIERMKIDMDEVAEKAPELPEKIWKHSVDSFPSEELRSIEGDLNS